MLQQDLLDTLFLNKKALDAVGGTTTTKTATTTTDNNNNKITMKGGDGDGSTAGAEQCPVDHKSREAWLAQARAAQQQAQPTTTTTAATTAPAETKQQSSSSSSLSSGWGWWPRIPFSSSTASSTTSSPTSSAQQQQPQQLPPPQNSEPSSSLGTDRVVSSIPRSSSFSTTTTTNPPTQTTTTDASACPVNHEAETGADPATGNWVYPSEKMFFEAMRRKGHATQAADMKTVVPIHNAVNERAWHEIRTWEQPYEGKNCPGGPRLDSFTGLSTKMSPKARLNTLLGYTAPFDRHDWVVDRCGTKVEYVIDFYAGKQPQQGKGAQQARGGATGPSFYLDVRPKLNSWEGVRMRALRGLGLV